jgi:hypothetical protein
MTTGVEFENDNKQYTMGGAPQKGIQGNHIAGESVPKSIRWMMGKNLVKSPKVGQIILVAIVIINIILAYIIYKL